MAERTRPVQSERMARYQAPELTRRALSFPQRGKVAAAVSRKAADG
ncbi:MAG: hypothetical protein IKH34_03440 [Oscillospiraceae bacterium]|nr:hypothetical protein [Oscillospiraceae bacterium]